jgi:hypothetical protein
MNFRPSQVTVEHLEEYLREVLPELSTARKANNAPKDEEESAPVSMGEERVSPSIAGEIEAIVTEEIAIIPRSQSLDPVDSLCRQWAEAIENLEEQRQELALTARIGQHYLRKGYRYHPHSLEPDINTYFLAVSKESLEQVTDWTALARQQTETIRLLREQIADLQRLTVIGSAKLDKWRR